MKSTLTKPLLTKLLQSWATLITMALTTMTTPTYRTEALQCIITADLTTLSISKLVYSSYSIFYHPFNYNITIKIIIIMIMICDKQMTS